MAAIKKKYGLDWQADSPDAMIELTLAKKWKEWPYSQGRLDHPAEHLLRACRMLFTPKEFTIHRWTEEHAQDFTETDFCVTWGAAATSKSNDYGLFLLLDWIVDPMQTVSLLGSTTLKSLRSRSWESVARYFNILQKHPTIAFPGKHTATGFAILNKDEDGVIGGQKAGLFGVPLDDGGKLQGAHLPYVRILIDEIATLTTEGARQAIEDAMSNLRSSATSFKCFPICNPGTWFDLGGYYAVPKDGIASVNVTHTRWESKFGRVRHHDCYQSPAILEPGGAEKYPFLVKQRDIDAMLSQDSADSPRFWKFYRGFPAPQGFAATVLDEIDIINGNATQPPPDTSPDSPFFGTTMIGALDSAFSEGGDAAILQACCVRTMNGLPTLCLKPPQRVPILASSERPVTYQLCDFVRAWSVENKVSMDRFAADASGNQSVSDLLTVEIGPGVLPLNYSNAASDLPISVASQDPAKARVRNLIAEAYAVAASFIKFGQVRGLSQDAARQITARMYMTRKGAVVEPRSLERKEEFKSRTKLGSPDEADAFAMVCYLARHRLGIVPGSGVYTVRTGPREDRPPRPSLSQLSSARPSAAGDPFSALKGRYGVQGRA